jgi:hypothetical protein
MQAKGVWWKVKKQKLTKSQKKHKMDLVKGEEKFK